MDENTRLSAPMLHAVFLHGMVPAALNQGPNSISNLVQGEEGLYFFVQYSTVQLAMNRFSPFRLNS